MAEKKIAVAQVIPANYFGVRNKRTNPTGGAGSKRATIGIGGGKGASGGGDAPTGPVTRMTGGMADGVEGPPQIEGQEAIASQGRMPRFAVGNPNAGVIDLSSILSERPNEAFDSSKPIGGENVPYKATKGLSGLFRRAFGDRSNERNLEAQGAQAADWRREDAEIKKQAREDEIEARRAARGREEFDRQQAAIDARRSGDREYQLLDSIFDQARRSDEKQQDIARADKQRLEDRVAADARYADTQNLLRQRLSLDEKVANATIAAKNKPETGYKSLGDGMFEEQSTGQLFRYDPGMPGKEAGMFSKGRAERLAGLVPVNPQTLPPRASANDVPVDPATGQPLQPQASSAAQSGGSMGETMVAPQRETSARISPPKSFEMTDVGPPDLMTQYNMRAKELRAGSRETPETAISPLTRPLYANMAALLNVQPEQVGASRFSNIPEDVVASNPDKYMEMFGKLPEEYQRYAVDDALRKSYEEQEEQNRKDPRKSGWSYK